jgi:hypothetical protein
MTSSAVPKPSSNRSPRLNATSGSVLVVPIAYALGFLAWASFLHQIGAGFYLLRAPQYLTVGAVFATLFGPMIVLERYYHENGWFLRGLDIGTNAILMQVKLSAGRVLAFWGTFTVLGGLYQGLGLFAFERYEISIYSILLALTIGAVGIVTALSVHFFAGCRWLIDRFIRYEGNHQVQLPGIFESTVHRTRDRVVIAVQAIFYVMVGSFVFGSLLLAKIEPAYGGARPQEAQLALDPTHVPGDLRDLLWRDLGNQTGWTDPVRIVLRTEDVFLVRLESGPQLHEVPRSTITAVRWLE